MKKLILLLLVFMGSVFASDNYIIDNNNSNAYFKSKAEILFLIDDEITGVNNELKGSLTIDNKKIKGKIFIDSSAFDTQNDIRDEHITEILNYENFKHIIITIEEEVFLENKLHLKSKLLINGVSKQINIQVIKKVENDTLLYTGKVLIKYSDFNIEPPTLGGFIKQAEDEIEIGAKILFVRNK